MDGLVLLNLKESEVKVHGQLLEHRDLTKLLYGVFVYIGTTLHCLLNLKGPVSGNKSKEQAVREPLDRDDLVEENLLEVSYYLLIVSFLDDGESPLVVSENYK